MLLGASPVARAGQDWAYLKSARVAEPGHAQLSLGLIHSVQQTWAQGQSFSFMRDSVGSFRLQRSIKTRLDLGWQASDAWGLKLGVPYNFAEFSPFTPAGAAPSYRLNDPDVRRADSLGDLSLEWRRAWGVEESVPGSALALLFTVTGPSGLGPFESPHPMAATGEGRWQVEPGFVLSAFNGTLSLVAQVSAPIQAGRETTLSSEAALGFGPNAPLQAPGGNVWLGPRYGVNAGLGFGWQWYAAEDSRQVIAIELQGWQRSPLDLGGTLTPDTEQMGLRSIPQLQADFGRFHALASWELPFIYANNEAASDFGASHLRVDYGF